MTEPIARRFLEELHRSLHGSLVGKAAFYPAGTKPLVGLVGRRRSDGAALLEHEVLRLDCQEPAPTPESPPSPLPPLPQRVAAFPALIGAPDKPRLRDAWKLVREQFTDDERTDVERWLRLARDGAALLGLLTAWTESNARPAPAAPATSPSRGPTLDDWETLVERLGRATKTLSVCALPRLIYVYWHEEAGVYWALERVADRFENNVHVDTYPLRGLHLEERDPNGVGAADLLATYINLRRRQLLSPLAERWKQYLMQYGFTPAIARGWPALNVSDVRAQFPPALHRWIREALLYYRSLEDLQRSPDVVPAKAASEELCRQIAEGGENLGDQPYAEIVRPEIELGKLILGHPQLHGKLGIRSGTGAMMASWEHSLDAIATLYNWRRPSSEHYRHLAERGELLVLVHSLLQAAMVPMGEGEYAALLALLRDHVLRYAISYQTVTGIDLRAQADARPPAEAMRAMPPPRVPPLRGAWTDQRASALAAEAAAAR
jgi:hypothetical protein